MKLKAEQQGFTLIELIVVIVILGILAAVAVPRFVDLRGDARAAAVQGVAGAISSGATINYAAALAGNTGSVAISGTATIACSAVAGSLLTGGTGQLGAGYSFPGNIACGTAGVTQTCQVQNTIAPSATATATIICTG